MTEKRFTSDYNGDESLLTHFLDNEKPLTKKEVLNLLNNLYEENQLLKNKLEFFNELNKPYSSIIKENKELKNKLHFVMKRLNEKDRLLARVLEVNKNLERKK